MTLEHQPRPQAPGAPGTEDQCSEQWWVQVAAGLLISMGFFYSLFLGIYLILATRLEAP